MVLKNALRCYNIVIKNERKYMKNRFVDRKDFIRILVTLCIPIVLQNLINTSVNLVDTVMVGQLGDAAVAGVGLANQLFFILNLFLFGVCSGASLFIAQFWGSKNLKGIHDTLGMALAIVIPVTLIYSALCMLIPNQLLGLFSKDMEVILLGAKYLRISAVSYIFIAISMQFSSGLRSIEKVKIPFYSNSIALIFNVIFNYLFIFGIGPFKEMGVYGAGLATTLARVVQLVLMLGFAYGQKTAANMPFNKIYSFDKHYLPIFLKKAIPVFLTESLWGMGNTLFFVVYARMSTSVVAAVNISKTIENFCLVFFFSLAGGTAISIGKSIGEGNEEKAQRYANSFSLFGLFVGAVLGGILFLVYPKVLLFFNVSQETIEIAHIYLKLFCLFVAFRGTAAIVCVGVLRSGGDTSFAMAIDIVPMWFICLPLAYLFGLAFDFPVWSVFIVVMSFDVLRLIPGFIRIKSKKWINNLSNK